jgi:hypothetical protein
MIKRASRKKASKTCGMLAFFRKERNGVMTESIGLGGYQGNHGAQRLGPRQIFQLMLRRAQLRSMLEIEASRIQEALPHLNAAETAQLKEMLSGEVAAADADVAALAQQVEAEASLAASTKAMNIRLSREASDQLQGEMMRRIERQGFCPAPAQLVADALARAYGGRYE